MNEIARYVTNVMSSALGGGSTDGAVAFSCLSQEEQERQLQMLVRFILELDVQSVETRRSYGKWMRAFLRWACGEGVTVENMQRVHILAYREYLAREGKSVKTRNSYMTAVRQFFSWAYSNGIVTKNPAERVKGTKSNVNSHIKSHLTTAQVKALLERSRKRSLRDYAMENLMIRTGLRTIEVSRAKVKDLIVNEEQVRLYVWGKGHAEADDYVVLTESAYRPLKEYLESRDALLPDAPLFASEGDNRKGQPLGTRMIQLIIKKDLRGIGLKSDNYSPHSLRHTTGVQIILNGGTVFDVQTVLRHVDPRTSEIYLESAKEEIRLKNAPENFLEKAF